MNLTAGILQAVADRFLVNIQADVIHTLHGGASLVVSESARSLSSAFVHQALLLTHTFKQLVEELVSHYLAFPRKDSTLVLGLYVSCAVGFSPIEHPGNKRTTHWYSYLVRAYGYSLMPVRVLFCPVSHG